VSALEGGTVIVGRPAIKEYMAGLRRGWTESLERVDEDEQLSRELEHDRRFYEHDEVAPSDPSSHNDLADAEPILKPRASPRLVHPGCALRFPRPAASTRDASADVSLPANLPP